MATIVDLGQKVKAKYPGQYDDLSDEELGRKVKAKYPDDYADFDDKLVTVKVHARKKPNQDWRKRATATLPMIGGGLGGAGGALLGGLGGTVGTAATGGLAAPAAPAAVYGGAVGGAALGGAGGKFAELELNKLMGLGEPMTGQQELGKVLGEGTLQGVFEGAGRGLGLLAKPAMRWALNSTPEVAQTAIKHGITATGMGLNKIKGMVEQAASATRALVTRHPKPQFQVSDIVKDVEYELTQDWISANPGRPIPPVFRDQLAKIQQLGKDFISDHPGLINALKLHSLKQGADEAASKLYQAIENSGKTGTVIPAVTLIEEKWQKAVADWARRRLEMSIPRYAEHNAATSAYAATRDAVAKVVNKEGGFVRRLAGHAARPAAGATIGGTAGYLTGSDQSSRLQHGLVGAAAGTVAGSPAAGSVASLVAANPWIELLLTQGPRAAVGTYQASR